MVNSQLLDLASRHDTYVQANVVNLKDPSGLFPERGDIVNDDAGFTCNCGWIDWNHVRKSNELAYTLLDDLEYISGHVPEMVSQWTKYWMVYTGIPLGLGPISGDLYHDFAVIPQSSTSPAGIPSLAVSIFMSANELFEEQQLKTGQILPGFAGGNRLKSSYYSEEDLPSDIIGFYIALERFKSKQNNPISSERLYNDVKTLCGAVSSSDSLTVFDQCYSGGAASQTNWRNWFPRFAPLTGCSANLCKQPRVWPSTFSQLTAQRIPPQFGRIWWWYQDRDPNNSLVLSPKLFAEPAASRSNVFAIIDISLGR